MKVYPKVLDERMVGEYPGFVKSVGGFVWDEVLEYRVWCHPVNRVKNLEEEGDYYYAFASYYDALEFSKNKVGSEEPIALILQKEFIDESDPEKYIHVKQERLTEWPVEFLDRPKRNDNTIPYFLSPDAPENRLDILRGLIK